jgi:hypothetical protein
MLTTYKAILRGNRLEWSDEAPVSADTTPLMVHVTILTDKSDRLPPQHRGQLMAERLEHLAALHGLHGIPDAASWEREVRQDRPLPDRG